MKLAIVGSRNVEDRSSTVKQAMESVTWDPTEILYAQYDSISKGIQVYAGKRHIPTEVFESLSNISEASKPGRAYKDMVAKADALLVIWKGTDRVTLGAIDKGHRFKKSVHVEMVQ